MGLDRVIIIVLDSVGIGALPDAYLYGDEGSNTLVNVANAVGGLNMPNMEHLGLGNITAIKGITPQVQAAGSYGRMAERSPGKDTITGHWEIAGIILEKPFPVYPDGFPAFIIEELQRQIGRPVLGNYAASGTEIIEKLGLEHLKTGYPIVYTSADSVFQIAAHEEIIPPEQLYEICAVARSILTGEHEVARVIARPFTGSAGNFTRTANRKDFAILPPKPTLLDHLADNRFDVISVGKIKDIFVGRGISHSFSAKTNSHGIDQLLKAMKQFPKGLIFCNLVEYDSNYGHRNDPDGYARALMEFDHRLPEILSLLDSSSVLIITADHGCDPTFTGTDHTREYVPIIVYGDKVKGNVDLGVRDTFADLGATVCEIFNINPLVTGTSFWPQIFNKLE
ncbi:MAG: phosphopentomutase [Syntrophomonadaceae bacterium]|nr:phosphopentomutase [Syntrophomonadaceae bacterium]